MLTPNGDLTPSKEQGLDSSSWKQLKLAMLNTGEFNPDMWNSLSDYQKYFVNELKKSYRDLSKS